MREKQSFKKLYMVSSKIKTAKKNKWLKHEGQEIDQLNTQHDDFNLHEKLKSEQLFLAKGL